MPGIMADNDVGGHFKVLLRRFGSPYWRDVWQRLGISVVSFGEFQLSQDSPDRLVWETCQAHEIVLFTGNRNNEGPDSLEETIRSQNRPDSWPVITLSDTKRFLSDNAYIEQVTEAVLDILIDLDRRRGAGRLYVP